MSIFDTKHKRKSAVITSVILVALLYLIFNFGMRYLDPPEEYGVAINYGVSDVGRGEPKVVEKIKTSPKPPAQEEKIEETVEEVPKETVQEEVVTQETKEDVPVIEKPKKEEKKEEPKEEPKEEKPKPKPKPKKPSENTMKAFDNLLNGDKSDGKTKGEGDDKTDGLKGEENGDPKSSKYYGNTGGDKGDPDYVLDGRNAKYKAKVQPDCQEAGIVVVSIEVDKTGKVVKAVPGVKGTTNSAKCLMDAARSAALKTTWNADAKAPSIQRGTIKYNFVLTK